MAISAGDEKWERENSTHAGTMKHPRDIVTARGGNAVASETHHLIVMPAAEPGGPTGVTVTCEALFS